jgi:tripartite-type tricarboxylate transporter receptor subunit TctC
MKKLLLIAMLLCANFAHAQWTPGKNTVKVIIPFAPGGGVDVTYRRFEKFAETKNITIIPDYHPGAEGVIGMNAASLAPKDGLTLVITTGDVTASKDNPAKKYDSLKSFDPITGIRSSIFYIASNNTGKDVFGFNTPTQKQILLDYIETKKIADPILVPYKGAGQVINDLLSGNIGTVAMPAVLLSSHVASGKIKMVKSVTSNDDFIALLPAGCPPEVKKFWNEVFREYLASSQYKIDAETDFTHTVTFSGDRIRKSIERKL